MRSIWPTSTELTQEVIKALLKFGGRATVDQIDKQVKESLNLNDDLLKTMRSENRSELQYRLAWVRTKAKQKGLVTRTSPGVWEIAKKEEN
jgi:restriction system protein